MEKEGRMFYSSGKGHGPEIARGFVMSCLSGQPSLSRLLIVLTHLFVSAHR